MKFKIPFTISKLEKLKQQSKFFKKFIKPKRNAKLQSDLDKAEIPLTREEYLSICLKNSAIASLIILIFSSTALILLKVSYAVLLSIGLSLLFGGFVFFSQRIYPHIYLNRKQREIEKNLIPALQDMLIQLNAGIPLFTILVNISSAEYSALSDEFKKAVKKINAGMPEIEVLEQLGKKNSSLHFRRTIWQISNGMRAGSDISIVIEESIKSLEEEQILQIQNYGNKLNPLVMFYMLITIILPSLGITFFTIISSLVNLPQFMTALLFVALYVFILIIQFSFLGLIKSARPSLL